MFLVQVIKLFNFFLKIKEKTYGAFIQVKYFIKFHTLPVINKNKFEKKDIIFISDHPTARIKNIAYELKKNGWTINFLFGQKGNFQVSNIGNIEYYVASYQALYYFKRNKNCIIHLIDQPFRTTYLFLKYFNDISIYSPIDIFYGTLNLKNKTTKKYNFISNIQYKCLKISRYIIFRDLQIRAIKNYKDLKLNKKKTLFFHDYLTKIKPIKSEHNDIIKVVSAGNLRTFDYRNGEAYVDLAKHIINAGYEFHIYPHYYYNNKNKKTFLEDHPKLKELAENKLLIIHECIDPKLLSEELSQYDYGVLLNGEHFYKKYGSMDSSWISKYYYKNAGSRIIDYIEAGIKIIASHSTPHNFQFFIANRYSNVVDANELMKQDVKNFLQKANINQNFKNISTLSYKYNIKRLIKFYKEIHEKII
tara:strand:+ start:1914 stop:3167 length:1254 start_codon:yes stop_codon:yes gene_type:complete